MFIKLITLNDQKKINNNYAIHQVINIRTNSTVKKQ